jgi:DNA-binding response OmpR family regulator
MPSVLAIVAGVPAALEGRTVRRDSISLELRGNVDLAIEATATSCFDLLVLAGMPVDEQQRGAAAIQQHRRWRVVPVLYVLGDESPGFAVPGSYRPELDSIIRGPFGSPRVDERIALMAREGVSTADVVIAGPYELDAVHGRLRRAARDVEVTGREAEILALLLANPDQTVSALEIIERAWGTHADDRHLQILRRHVSNIRRKLADGLNSDAVSTVRGTGYRFNLRTAG